VPPAIAAGIVVVVVWHVLDEGPSYVSENSVKIGLIVSEGNRIIVEDPLYPPIQKYVLHALRANYILDEAPRLGSIQDVFGHGNKTVQGTIALGIHPDIHIPAVLMGPVVAGRSSGSHRKITQIYIAGIGELSPNRLDSIQQSAHNFRCCVCVAFFA